MKKDVIIIAIISAFVLAAIFGIGICICLNRPFSSETMHNVWSETMGMSASDALQAFKDAGFSDAYLAKTLNSSRYTIRRLRNGEEPTTSMNATILGLYSNFLLLKRSRLLFYLRFSKGYDQWYAFPNPLQEQL